MNKTFHRTRKESPKVIHAKKKDGASRTSGKPSGSKKSNDNRSNDRSANASGKPKSQKKRFYEDVAKASKSRKRKKK